MGTIEHDGLATGQRRVRWAAGSTPEVSPPVLVEAQTANEVRTTRFTPVTWLPKSLFWQFQRVANVYFLLIAVLVCFPSITTKKWQSKVFPFVGVLLWTALKDLYEDSNRRRDDRLENERVCQRYAWSKRSFKESQWRSCSVGDLMLVCRDELFPVDMLLLASSDAQGACFISTLSLDGETNLKERRAVPATQATASPASNSSRTSDPADAAVALHQVGLEALLEAPHANLGEANGSLALSAGSSFAQHSGVGMDNFLPRGCVLRNTKWVLGLAAYVGPDTKVRLNAAEAPTKVSDMQVYLSRCVFGLLAALFVVCFYFAVAGKVAGAERNVVILFLRYLITLYHVVPISLYVMFEILKLVLGQQINADPLMADPETGKHAEARTSDLVEEMGQVGFVFSDKTGTLTANEMRFAYGFVAGRQLGPFLPGAPEPLKSLAPAEIKALLPNQTLDEFGSQVLDFFTLLAVCHAVQLDDRGKYQAASPDEIALVAAAHEVGLEFAGRESVGGSARVTLRGPAAQQSRAFLIPQVLEFDSDRKRMSVVCAEEDGSATVYTKGADVALVPLMSEALGEETLTALHEFSLRGLRTLVCTSRKVPSYEYSAWKTEWEAAGRALEGRAALVAAAAAKLEQGLRFVGVTAVEDRLQDKVPETIAALRSEAGLRVWVLTGDKVETAVEIAKSVRLFDSGMVLHRVLGLSSSEAAVGSLRAATEAQAASKAPCGMVLDGQTVHHILESDEARSALYKLGIASQACVCCRLSPAQKKELVELVRLHDPSIVTLAIGDGANDVPMIQGAHIGIGIRGKEGMGAVQASDVAISQFCFLRNLLFCHGRRSYHHVALFLCYYLYKNVALAWGDIVHAHDVRFQGDIAYPEWLSTSFNALFTSWPVVVMLAFDRDLPDEKAVEQPRLYRFGPERRGFNWRIFTSWMVLAALHGCLAWVCPVYLQWGAFRASRGERVNRERDFWIASTTAFTVVIEVITLKLALVSSWPITKLGTATLLGAVAIYLLVLFLLGPIGLQEELRPDVPGVIFSHAGPLLCLLLVPVVALLPDAAVLLHQRWAARRGDLPVGTCSTAPTTDGTSMSNSSADGRAVDQS